MSSLFGKTQTTQSSNQQSGSSSSQGNLAGNPGYQAFLSGYSNLANNGIGNITTPTNPFGQQAGQAQAGVAANLNPAYAAAGSAAAGTTYGPNSYQPFMSPYTNDVTNAIKQQFGTTLNQAAEATRGNLAAQGALGNSNNPVAIANALTPISNAENTAIANNIQQGFNTANQNAQAAGQFKLSGANALGNLAGVNTGVNAGLANIGQGLFGDQISAQEFPAQLANLYNQGWGQANAVEGQNYTSNSSGTGTGTTTQNPSLFSDIAGMAGLAFNTPWSTIFGGNGQAASTGNEHKDGGRIKPYHEYADGGAVIDLDPVLLSHLVHGPLPMGRFADGGDVQEEPKLGVQSWLAKQIEDARAKDADTVDTSRMTNAMVPAWEAVKMGGELTGIPQAFRAKDAIADAYNEPSIGSLTNAGAQTALTLLPFKPAIAMKGAAGALGAGYGTALAKDAATDLPSLATPAHAEDADPLDQKSRARLNALQDKKSLTRAEREEQNHYLDIIAVDRKAKADAATSAARIKAEAEATAEGRRLSDAAELEGRKRAADQERFDAAVKSARSASAAELAKGDNSSFQTSSLRDVYNKTGGPYGLAMLLGGAFGAADRLATGPATTSWTYPRRAAEGLAGASIAMNAPLGYDAIMAPTMNPEKAAALAYLREGPLSGDPDRARWEDIAKREPDYNPVKKAAMDHLLNPVELAEREFAATIAGAPVGIAGGNIGSILSKVPQGLGSGLRGAGNLASDAALGTADVVGSIPNAVKTANNRWEGRAALAKADAAGAQQSAAEAQALRDRAVGDGYRAATDALGARDDLAEAVRRSSDRAGAVDRPVSPLPERPVVSDRNGPLRDPNVMADPPYLTQDKTPPFDVGQGERIENGVKDLSAAIQKIAADRATKAAEVAPAPVIKELPAPKAPSYSTKYKSVAQPFITGRVAEGRDVPSASEVMGQFDRAGMKQPSFKTVDERVTDNAPRLLSLIYSKNPGITPPEAARMLGDLMANPKNIPSDWGLPKEFILPSVAAPIAGAAVLSGNREERAEGGMVAPEGYENHVIPEGHAWEHKGVGSKVRGPDGSFVSMNVAQPVAGRKNGGKAPVKYSRNYAHGGVVVGPVVGTTGGRTDAKPVSVPANAYVIPADVVSAMPGAEGNTLAGMQKLTHHFGKSWNGMASGGMAHKPVPILISDGEFVVHPDAVAKTGNGDVKHGHRVLDAMVKKIRAQNIKKLKSLPAPAQ